MAATNRPPKDEANENQSQSPAEDPQAAGGTQATDQVAQTNFMTLGLGPAIATVNSYMAQSQSQALLFANAVQQQQREAIAGLSVATESASRILDIDSD